MSADACAVLASVQASLPARIDGLRVFLSGSERAFLETGKRLQGLAERSQTLLASADWASGLDPGNGDSAPGESACDMGAENGSPAPAESLHEALAVMERHFAASQAAMTSGLSALSKVVDCARQVTKFAPYFQQVERTFGMLATCLRLEHGRSAGKSGFDAVSADVVRLGAVVADRFRTVFDRATSLQRAGSVAHTDQSALLVEQSRRAAELLRDAQASLAAFSELHASNEAIRQQAAESSQRISKATTDILVHLQAHDITRQMLEHAVEALSPSVRAASSCSVPCHERHEAVLGEVSTLSRIQARQVGSARRALAHANDQIARSLRLVSAEVAKISEQTARVTDRGSVLENMEQRLAGLAEALRSQMSSERQTLNAAAHVVEASTAMGVFVGEIGGLAHDVKLVALNAFVKAVKAGSSGAVFAVLAQAIKDMSVEVTANTEQLMAVMTAIAESGHALKEDFVQDGDDIGQIETRLRQLTEVVRHREQDAAASLESMRRGSAVIASEVEGLTADLSGHAAAIETLDEIERELSTLADVTAKFANRTGAPHDRQQLAGVADLYTMEAERRIHRRVTEKTDGAGEEQSPPAPAQDGNIEFF